MKSRLDVALSSVPAGPSPDDTDSTAHDLEGDAQPQGESGDEGQQADGQGGKRSVENVRGELLRKMDKQKDDILRELGGIREALTRAHEQYGTPAPSARTTAPQTLDDMSVAELETMLPNIPEDHRANFLTYLQERKVEAKVEERLRKYEQTTEFRTAEQRFNAAATTRWPALRDRQSEFYRTTDRILSEMGASAANNPRAVLDAANEAGIELGLSPADGVQRVTNNAMHRPGRVATGKNARSAPGSEEAADDPKFQQIAENLRDAMPGRKFTEEQLQRIATRRKQYREEIHTRLRG